MISQTRSVRRAAVERYRDAIEAVFGYNEKEVVRWKAAEAEDTVTRRRVHAELRAAEQAAPRWGRLVWGR